MRPEPDTLPVVEGSPEGAPEQSAHILIPEAQIGGVWSNFARVSHSEHEFTLDFIRLDYASAPPQGIVVARVSVSPLFITQLIDAIRENWEKYAEKALPKEFRDERTEPGDQAGTG